MNRSFLPWLLLTLFALSGLYLLGNGMTGLVISQSCCTPGPGVRCPVDSLCEQYAQQPQTEIPGSINRNQEIVRASTTMSIAEGSLLLVATLAIFYMHFRKRMAL